MYSNQLYCMNDDMHDKIFAKSKKLKKYYYTRHVIVHLKPDDHVIGQDIFTNSNNTKYSLSHLQLAQLAYDFLSQHEISSIIPVQKIDTKKYTELKTIFFHQYGHYFQLAEIEKAFERFKKYLGFSTDFILTDLIAAFYQYGIETGDLKKTKRSFLSKIFRKI